MGHHAVKVHLHDTHSALVLQHSFAIVSDMIWNLYQGVETLKKKRRKSEWCISSEKDILKMSQYFSQLYNKSQWGSNSNVILDPTAFQSMLLWMVLVMKSSYQWWAHQVSGIPNILLCLSIPAVEGVSESLLQGQNQLIKHDHFRSLQIYKIHIFFMSENPILNLQLQNLRNMYENIHRHSCKRCIVMHYVIMSCIYLFTQVRSQ